MKRTHLSLTIVALAAALLVPLGAAAAQDPTGEENFPKAPDPDLFPPQCEAGASTEGFFFQPLTCVLNRPSQVQRWAVRCNGATRLDAWVADCCIPGDHWQLKSKVWDSGPNTAVTTSPGPANAFSVSARTYNYSVFGGVLQAEVDCSYLHGVNVFPAGANLFLSADGPCTVTNLGVRDEIYRSP